MNEIFDWLKPAPLWKTDGSDVANRDLFKPNLLKFSTDTFIKDFIAAVKQSAMGVPGPLAALVLHPPGSKKLIRLYQPVHGVFQLVCGSLCCRQAGFPDRSFSRASGDKVSFVIRKLSQGSELGWVGATGAQSWTNISNPAISAPAGENRLPLMNVNTQDGRTLLFGYIPVGSRETYAAGADVLGSGTNDILYGLAAQEFGARFMGNLVTTPIPPQDTPPPAPGKPSVLETFPLTGFPNPPAHPNQLDMSIFLLRDLVDFFEASLPAVGMSLPPNTAIPLYPEAQTLITTLKNQTIQGKVTLWSALTDVANLRTQIDEGGDDLSALGLTDDYNLAHLNTTLGNQTPPSNINDLAKTLMQQVNNAANATANTAPPQAFQLPKMTGDHTYIIRLIYERTACTPPQQWLSRHSDKFHFAGIFDPDAPARPINIVMPGNVSIAGIRKFKKNVSMIMSDQMRNKAAMVTGGDIIKGSPGSSPGFGIGLICSFSIQIIFIVAFMLLLIFVILLNLVFFWLPFFKICFPIPTSAAPSDA